MAGFALLLKMRKKRVLVVDDEAFIRELVRDCLVDLKLEIIGAPDVPEALGHLKAGSFDLVILDWNLGQSCSVGVLEFISSLPVHPPVILMTGDHHLQVGEGQYAVVTDSIFKPFKVDDFLHKISKVLHEHEI